MGAGLGQVPGEEHLAGVLEGLQHGGGWRPDKVAAIEWGLPRSLEPPMQLCQVGAHLVPPEPAHDGVDGPQSPAAPPRERASPCLGARQGGHWVRRGQAPPGPASLSLTPPPGRPLASFLNMPTLLWETHVPRSLPAGAGHGRPAPGSLAGGWFHSAALPELLPSSWESRAPDPGLLR